MHRTGNQPTTRQNQGGLTHFFLHHHHQRIRSTLTQAWLTISVVMHIKQREDPLKTQSRLHWQPRLILPHQLFLHGPLHLLLMPGVLHQLSVASLCMMSHLPQKSIQKICLQLNGTGTHHLLGSFHRHLRSTTRDNNFLSNKVEQLIQVVDPVPLMMVWLGKLRICL